MKDSMKETRSSYAWFAVMIITSMAVMFVEMYLNTYALSHVRWSETRFYMMFVMGAGMAVVMLAFMRHMYARRQLNLVIFIASGAVFAIALWLVRSQVTVEDSSYMRAMIPHHSIAVLTSERAEIRDARVRELADGIIRAQRREIKEMDWLIDDIRKNGIAETQAEADQRPVPDFVGTP